MKTKLSFILFFVFLFYSSQDIADKEKFKKCRKDFSKKICLSDEDKDSLFFYLDECPKIFGVAENNGCPWPDSDGDGSLDKDDACVDLVGPKENIGCPWPDTDGDGILDKDDKCPTVSGTIQNNGCPQDDCEKKYKEDKNNYEKSLEQLKITNFNNFFDKLFESEIFKKINSDNKKIILFYFDANQMLSEDGAQCGNIPYSSCLRYNKHIYDDIFIELWNKENYEKLQKIFKNKVIIPLSKLDSENNNNGYQYLKSIDIQPLYTGIFINTKNEKKNFYYTSTRKSKTNLILYVDERNVPDNSIKISLSVIPMLYKFPSNIYYVSLYSTETTMNWHYEYKNGEWRILNEFK